jgi:flavin reductase (DIM6/NTAB) family NADH-FMN oxidoreductase RutF
VARADSTNARPLVANGGVTADAFKAAMASFAAGVTIVTTIDEHGNPQAVTATAFSSVSLSPPLCLVCIDRRARTYRPILYRRSFAVNILRAEQEWLSNRFASAIPDRFSAVSWVPGGITGCPIIEEALASMECEVVEVHTGGDHDIFLGSPTSVRVHDGAPLVYFRGNYSSLPPDETGSDAEPSFDSSPRATTAHDFSRNESPSK